MAEVGGIASDQLRSFVERIERLNEEAAALKADQKAVFDEAKGDGFDPKILKLVIRRRAMSDDDRQHEDAMLRTYERVLAGWGGTPLGDVAARRGEEELAKGIKAGTVDIKFGDDPWMSEQLAEADAARRKAAE